MDRLFELETEDHFRKASEEVINNLHTSQSATNIENIVITQAKEELKQLILSNNFDFSKVRNELQGRPWNRDRIEGFLSELEQKSSEILYNTVLQHNSRFGETLVDFDWRLKMVLGTSELKTLKYPLFQLLLTTNTANGQKQTIYELNKDMLKKLIDVLEAL